MSDLIYRVCKRTIRRGGYPADMQTRLDVFYAGGKLSTEEYDELWETIAGAVVTGLLTLMGVLISNSRSQAVTETKLEELTREVREHNNFARRVPVVEEQIRVMDRRMTALEKYKD